MNSSSISQKTIPTYLISVISKKDRKQNSVTTGLKTHFVKTSSEALKFGPDFLLLNKYS